MRHLLPSSSLLAAYTKDSSGFLLNHTKAHSHFRCVFLFCVYFHGIRAVSLLPMLMFHAIIRMYIIPPSAV